MDIIFVNPPLTLKERFGKFAPAGNVMPPLGLCYLAAMCRDKGIKTEIIDAPAENLDLLQTKERNIIKNLDILPMPEWNLLQNYPHQYNPLEIAMSNRLQGSIITSRGCP